MKRSELIERVRFITHGPKKILQFNFSGLAAEEVKEAIGYGSNLIAKMPDASVLTLTNITDANYDKEITEALKTFTRHNKQFVIAGAVVGVSGLKKVIFQAVTTFSGRTNLRLFNDELSAKDWLVAYR